MSKSTLMSSAQPFWSPIQHDERQIDLEEAIATSTETGKVVTATTYTAPDAVAFIPATRKVAKVKAEATAIAKRTAERSKRAERVRNNAFQNMMSPGYLRGLTNDALVAWCINRDAQSKLESIKGKK